jgi:hypothetical protein
MSFMNGMSAWDKRSMERGQERIRERNAQGTEECNARIEQALAQEKSNPDPAVTSLALFCGKYGVAKKSLYRPERSHYLAEVMALPYMRGPGNPQGWAKNAWYVD